MNLPRENGRFRRPNRHRWVRCDDSVCVRPRDDQSLAASIPSDNLPQETFERTSAAARPRSGLERKCCRGNNWKDKHMRLFFRILKRRCTHGPNLHEDVASKTDAL